MRVLKTDGETDTGTAYGHCTGTVRALYGHCTGTVKTCTKTQVLDFAKKKNFQTTGCDRQRATDGTQQARNNRQQTTNNRQQTTDDRQTTTNKHLGQAPGRHQK